MDENQVLEIRGLIDRRMEELEKQLEEESGDTSPVSPDVSIGRLSRLDAMQMQQVALDRNRRRERERQELQEALRRLLTGDFGYCERCGQAIAWERIKVQPQAVLCVRCAR